VFSSVFHGVRIEFFMLQVPLPQLRRELARTVGIRARFKAWVRDPVIEWAHMVRRRSVSPTHGGSSGSKSRGKDIGGMFGGDHGSPERGIVIHRITKEVSSSAKFPVLMKTNYIDWATLMRLMLQARGLCIAVSMGTDDYTEDHMALEVIAKVVPTEMIGSIATKATAKIAWDAIWTM
jgi:hypothetical protein